MNSTSHRVSAPTTDAQAKSTAVVVRYHYADGILLEGDTGPYKDAIEKAEPRWRWFRSLGKWGVPLTRGRVMSSSQVEKYARGLVAAGVPKVRLEFHDPTPEDVRAFDEAPVERKRRALARARLLQRWADRLEAAAAAKHDERRAAFDEIPVRQQNLVEHRSERLHSSELPRAGASTPRSIEASEAAEDARHQGETAEHNAAQHENPCDVLRRLRELSKEARELQVRITGEAPPRWRGPKPGGPATGETLERLRTAAEENRQRAACHRQVLDRTGHMPSSESVLRKGDRVITHKGRATVQRLRPQHVELRFDRAVSWNNGPQHVRWVAYSLVWVAKAADERHQDSERTQGPRAPETSAAAAAGPPKPFSAMVKKRKPVTGCLPGRSPQPDRSGVAPRSWAST
ncbi:DUF3560 domain-containing protein, partial [Paraliomyxa miuraensis]|uniref:DUF3560 domain-containing protein n=1 Tax=Paraliomyxa miuraensis TaxID=376150 RepID=UPI00224E012F